MYRWPLKTSTTLWSTLWPIIIEPFLVTSVLGICNFHNPNLVTFIHFFILESSHFYGQGRSTIPSKIALEFVIPRLNPLVVVDFSFVSAYVINSEFTGASDEISASSVFLNLI